MNNKLSTNEEAYKTEAAIDKYSQYFLYPNEKYLIGKYFKKDQTILDLACGAGRTTVRLHEMGFKVKGTDLSDVLIGIAQRRFPYINFECGSYCDIKEADASFENVLVSHNGLDYAYPESERLKALKECARVLKPGGHLVFSTHNIKSLHFSPFYLKQRKMWMLKNTWRAFREHDYIFDLEMWTFYTSPAYCIKQVESTGLEFVEMMGFRSSKNNVFNTYFSPYIHFVFKKPEGKN